jgi:pimeloyl-ACP methyl ester carboxylesterase
MKAFIWLALISVFAAIGMLLVGACDDDDDDNDDDNDDNDNDDDATPPPGCDTLHEGWNGDYVVDGVPRSFFLDLPEGVEDSWPWAVVFSWHGFGDTAANFRGLIDWLADNDDLPFIGVTVEDTGMLFDWDIIDGVGAENREVLLFDALLEELDTCWGVDRDHVHVMGFSFGGGIAALMGVRRGDGIASIATCSGVYGSNPANVIPYTVANWPELTTENRYVELRLHGGILDNMILPFGAYGVNDRKYLNQSGHDVIECIHPFIHNMGFLYMGPETFIEFFADHPLGTHDSPYAAGMPADYPENCTYQPKD